MGFTEDIIIAAIAKEEHAITYLYNETYNSVFQAIRPLIKDEDTVLDVLQDTYIKAFESLEQLEKPAQFRAWIKRIAQNKSKDWLKKKKPTLFSEMRPDDESGESDFIDDREFAQPDVTLDKEETRRLLWEIIDSLADEQRLVVSMYYFQEMPVKNIALELEISENTVKSRLNYARKNIESKVLVLEKQGTKLYSLAPFSFLLWLIRSFMETPSATALSEITGSLGISGATVGSTAGGVTAPAVTATGAGAATAGIPIVAKIVAGIVATAIVAGGGFALYQTQRTDVESVEVVGGIEEIQYLTNDKPDLVEEPVDLEALNAERISAYVKYVEGLGDTYSSSTYFLYDTDGDGLVELLMVSSNLGFSELASYVFTVDEQGDIQTLFFSSNAGNSGRAGVEFTLLKYQEQEYLAHAYSAGSFMMETLYSEGSYQLLAATDGKLDVAHVISWKSQYNVAQEATVSAEQNIDGVLVEEAELSAIRETSVVILDINTANGMSRNDFLSEYADT